MLLKNSICRCDSCGGRYFISRTYKNTEHCDECAFIMSHTCTIDEWGYCDECGQEYDVESPLPELWGKVKVSYEGQVVRIFRDRKTKIPVAYTVSVHGQKPAYWCGPPAETVTAIERYSDE